MILAEDKGLVKETIKKFLCKVIEWAKNNESYFNQALLYIINLSYHPSVPLSVPYVSCELYHFEPGIYLMAFQRQSGLRSACKKC